MARVIRSNRLTAKNELPKVAVPDAYNIFLRIKKSECAPSTYNIYDEIGRRHIIPKLVNATDNDMNSITGQVIRDILDDYEFDHGLGVEEVFSYGI